MKAVNNLFSIDDRVKDHEKNGGSFAKKQGGILNAILLIIWAKDFLCHFPATISLVFFQQQSLPKGADDHVKLLLTKPTRSGFLKTNRTRRTHRSSTVHYKGIALVVYQILLWSIFFSNDKTIHYSQGHTAPSKQSAIRILVIWVLPSCCEAAGGRLPNVMRNNMNFVILMILLVWILWLLYLLLCYWRVFLSRMRQPVDSTMPPSIGQSYPTVSTTLLSYIHDDFNWQNVPGVVYDEDGEQDIVEPAANPQQYPHMIEARRLEGVPNSSLVFNGESPHHKRSRHGSDSSDDTVGSVFEFGVGKPDENGDIVSFNAIVERGVSNISPSSSVDMDIAKQQAEQSDSDE